MRDRLPYAIVAGLVALTLIGADPVPASPPVPQPAPLVAASPTATATPLLARIVSTYAGTGKEALVDGSLLTASFKNVRLIAYDPDRGSEYVSDDNEIRELTSDGKIVTTAGGANPGNVDGIGANARFDHPQGIAYDSVDKSLYICDRYNREIRRMTADGAVTTIAGAPFEGRADGTGADARFSNPWGIAYDNQDGNLYVTEFTSNDIRRVTPVGVVTTLAGSKQGYADGVGSDAHFNGPTGIAYDQKDGDLYVVDSLNWRVRRITPGGAVTTFAGNGNFGIATGPAAKLTVGASTGIAWNDRDDSLYMVDEFFNTIRRIAPNGTISNIAGDGSRGNFDGVFEGAAFNKPVGIAVDPKTGYLYVADYGNNLVRLIK